MVMKPYLFVLLAILPLSPLHAAEAGLLVGKWKLGNDRDLGIECSGVYVEYRADGTTINVSGQNVSRATYELTPHKRGFLLTEKETANNGKPNCQGIDSQTVKDHTPSVVYMEVSRTELRFSRLENTDQVMFTFVREPSGKATRTLSDRSRELSKPNTSSR